MAEHSAVARALDCLSFCEGDGVASMSYGLCDDEAYLIAAEAPPLPTLAPEYLHNYLVDEMHTRGTGGKPEDVCAFYIVCGYIIIIYLQRKCPYSTDLY